MNGESKDFFSDPSSSASLDDPELSFSRTSNPLLLALDVKQGNCRLVTAGSPRSRIHGHQRSLSASSIPVQSFVSSAEPKFATLPRRSSTSKHAAHHRPSSASSLRLQSSRPKSTSKPGSASKLAAQARPRWPSSISEIGEDALEKTVTATEETSFLVESGKLQVIE